jgi:outer membrane murein-binding lipoprotein Lpp
MIKYKSVIAVIACTALAACASSSGDISPAYVSPMAYDNHTCDQLSAELQRISARVHQVSGDVDSRATNDKIAMGVGLVVFWPALFFLKGNGPETAELGRLKGEYDAVEEQGVQKHCGFHTPSAGSTASLNAPVG